MKKLTLLFIAYNLCVFALLGALNYTFLGKMISLPYAGIIGSSKWIGMLVGIFFINSIFSLGLVLILQKVITKETFRENLVRNYLIITLVLMLWASFRLSNTVCVEGECKTGKGKLAYKTGEIYEGEIEDYQANGTGKIFYLNGDIYSGGMELGKPSGKGILALDNAKEKGTIEGTWFNGKLNGEAKRILEPNKKIENLFFRDGKISESPNSR